MQVSKQIYAKDGIVFGFNKICLFITEIHSQVVTPFLTHQYHWKVYKKKKLKYTVEVLFKVALDVSSLAKLMLFQ